MSRQAQKHSILLKRTPQEFLEKLNIPQLHMGPAEVIALPLCKSSAYPIQSRNAQVMNDIHRNSESDK